MFLTATNSFGMWWPGTESNRRRQPFQGRIRSGTSCSNQTTCVDSAAPEPSLFWDSNGTEEWDSNLAGQTCLARCPAFPSSAWSARGYSSIGDGPGEKSGSDHRIAFHIKLHRLRERTQRVRLVVNLYGIIAARGVRNRHPRLARRLKNAKLRGNPVWKTSTIEQRATASRLCGFWRRAHLILAPSSM